MKYLALAAIATAVNAATSFNLISTKAGSIYDGKHVLNRPEHIELGDGDGNGISFVLNDDGSLVDAPAQKYVNFESDPAFLGSDHITGFSISDGKLQYNGASKWYGCPTINNALGYDTGCQDRSGVDLVVFNEAECDNVYPGAPKSQFYLKAWSEEGDQFSNTPIKKVDSHPHVFAVGGDEGKDLVVNFQDDGTSLVDEDGRGVKHDPNTGEVGSVAPFGREPATPGFGINGDHLVFEGRDDWKACPSGPDKFSLSDGECVGGTNIVLQVVWKANLLKTDDKKKAKRH
ncbi:hypothetical protein CA7LBN_004322 [Candidozyma auris]|uniref:Cell wall protein n=1 Tax=Candidozyma auris TaxID=498019 RepID=A0A8F2W5M0_CANAR|nr:hypothetical protein CA7LBN_004322 [[Candida] auris]